jgi:hypothetical protein
LRLARGLLVALGLLLAFALLFVWIALPPILGGVAVGILRDQGVQSDDMRVEIGADPPLRLIGLTADRVRLRASGVSIDRLQADSIDVTLNEVDIRAQTFESVEGRLEGVRITPPEGPTIAAHTVVISGPPEAAAMTLTLDEDDVERLIRSQVARLVGADVTSVALSVPDAMTIETDVETVRGRLAVDEGGGLVFREESGRFAFDLFRAGPDEPVRLDALQVAGSNLVVTGTVNLLAPPQ